MKDTPPSPRWRIRLAFGPDRMLGPGKAELLERIARTGSIAAAAREMGMSYKRAWQLVETLNAMFQQPLVARVRGGAQGGGAVLTETGCEVLAEYRQLEKEAEAAAADPAARLVSLLRAPPET